MSEKRIEKRRQAFERLANENISIAEAVKTLRKSVGKTQVDYARVTGVGLKSLRDVEQGKGNPSLATIEKLLSPFNLNLVVKPRMLHE